MKREIDPPTCIECSNVILLSSLVIVFLLSPFTLAYADETQTIYTAPQAEEFKVLQCLLSPDKKTWQADEIPRFRAYLNKSSGKIELVSNPDMGCMVQVDDKWYRPIEQLWVDGFDRYFSDWIAENGGFVTFALDPLNLKSIETKQNFKLTPGKHKVRFAWAEYGRKEPPRLISEPVTITIEKPQPPSHPSLEYNRERQMRDLFLTFTGGQEKSTENIPVKLKLDIFLQSQWRPKFTWADIPTLFKLAESNRVMKSNIPCIMISSYACRECTEGMVALWLIEGLRRKQLDLIAREMPVKTYPGMNALWHYNLPFNPICWAKGTPMSECESSPEIHTRTLQAYQSWWQKAKSMSPRDAAQVYPLLGKDLEWFGITHPMEKLVSSDDTNEQAQENTSN